MAKKKFKVMAEIVSWIQVGTVTANSIGDATDRVNNREYEKADRSDATGYLRLDEITGGKNDA